MKVSIIAFNNLHKSPYINIYSNFCKDNGIKHEIVIPNRDGITEETHCPVVQINWNPHWHKAINMLCFSAKVIKHLKHTKPDFVIVLTTMPVVLLSGYLSRHYKGRYLTDIRDYTYEHNRLYYSAEKRAIENAAMNVISSPGFKKFLPEAEYSLCQNISTDYAEGRGGAFKAVSCRPIVIGYVGTIAYKAQCMRLIKLVERDPRFCFHLYGNESGDASLSEYLQKNPCDRIKMFGPYKPAEKVEIMSKVDILFNAYGNGSKLLDYALSNKLYDSFYMRIPLLTSPGTAMSEESAEFSYDVDLENEGSLDGLYQWYGEIDGEAFDAYSENYLHQVFDAQDAFYEKLKKVLLR